MYADGYRGALHTQVDTARVYGGLFGAGAPRSARVGATTLFPYALRTSSWTAAATGGRLPHLSARLRPRSVCSSQDAEMLRSSLQAVVAIEAGKAQTEFQRARRPELIHRRPECRLVAMRNRNRLCGRASAACGCCGASRARQL